MANVSWFTIGVMAPSMEQALTALRSLEQSQDSDPQPTHFIYWDPSCSADPDFAGPRWILDTDEPSTTAQSDLDGDGQCNYLARINLDVNSPPVGTQPWMVNCDGSSWESNDVTIVLGGSAAPTASPTA